MADQQELPRSKRARFRAETIPCAEPFDADAWARRYVAAVLAADGWTVDRLQLPAAG